MKLDNIKTKIIILIASVALNGVMMLLYFLDQSLEWNSLKIISCIIVNLYLFFIIPSMRLFIKKFNQMDFEESFKLGFRVGYSKAFWPIIIAPYYGIKYYFNKYQE